MLSLFRKTILPGLLALTTGMAHAQLPTLKVLNKDAAGNPVHMEALKVDVRVNGSIATTAMTMTFKNTGSRELEGELTFPMPEGVTVSRYALDINGKMREAVPVEKAKATEVFESIEHRRVDPGLLEKVEGNNFRTRIYPLPAGGTRTILIGYEEELKPDSRLTLQYRLPFDHSVMIPDFKLNVLVSETLVKPELKEQPDGSFSFRKTGNTYVAELSRTNFTPRQSLVINLPKSEEMTEVAMQPAEGSYYFLVNAYPKAKSRSREWSDHIGLIWDVSLSGLYSDHKKQLELLGSIIDARQNLTIDLGLLNYHFVKGGSYTIRNGNWDQLRKKLETLIYDGGTNLSNISEIVLPADEYLLFSDGLSTFGPDKVPFSKPFHCITAASRSDYSLLKYLSNKSGGVFINLNNVSVTDAAKMLNEEPLMFLGIKTGAGVREVYPSMPVPLNGHISVAGIADSDDQPITLLFGYGKKVTMQRTVHLDGKNEAGAINISRVWAQKKIAEMDMQYDRNKTEITELGKEFGIVTRNTSLIVLEAVADYVRYEIQPPAELRDEYNRLRKEQLVQKENRMNSLLQSAFGMTTQLKEWYNTRFSTIRKYPKPDVSDSRHMVLAEPVNSPGVSTGTSEDIQAAPSARPVNRLVDDAGPANVAPPQPVMSAPARSLTTADKRMAEMESRGAANKSVDELRVREEAGNVRFTPPASRENALREEVVINRNAAKRNQRAGSYAADTTYATYTWSEHDKGSIDVPEFKSDKEYMKRLKGLNSTGAYKAYLKMRPEYVSTPLFYYDIAGWFYQHNNKDTALMIFSSIADLEVENAELYKLLTYKLKEHGLYEPEIFTAGKVLQWRPMDPQSYRDYALALQDGGYYQKALDTLYSTLTQSYSEDAANRDHGIEEILITEINNLIATHSRQLNISRIDKKLIQPIPVDVRVVLNWNKNETDIDLWVTDPNGEKCFYSNKLTAAGGRISDDFTAGFGPEQFMLKKAIKGKYKVEINYFGDRQLSISGPTTIMAEIYTRYSTGSQQRKVVTVQMPETQRESVLVGSFTF